MYYSMQASVCVCVKGAAGVSPPHPSMKGLVSACNGCSRGISPSPKYARFREYELGAAVVSPLI